MSPNLELLEDRFTPSVLGAMLPQILQSVQYESQQLRVMDHYMHIYWDLLSQDIPKGNDPGGAAENAYGAGTAFFAVQSYWTAGESSISVDRFILFAGLATGSLDGSDVPNIWNFWTTLNALDTQNNAIYADDLTLFNSPFPYGYEFPIPGIAGANSLANIYPGLNS